MTAGGEKADDVAEGNKAGRNQAAAVLEQQPEHLRVTFAVQ